MPMTVMKFLPFVIVRAATVFVVFGCLCPWLQRPALAQYTPDKAGLVDAVHDYKKSWWESLIVDKYYTFKLSPGCWAKLTEKDGWGISTTANSVTDFAEYAKKAGWGDFEAAESANNNDRDNNK